MTEPQPSLTGQIEAFLTELRHANRSAHTLRAYRTDLHEFAQFHRGPLDQLDAQGLRAFFEQHFHLSPASRARKQAAVASFLLA